MQLNMSKESAPKGQFWTNILDFIKSAIILVVLYFLLRNYVVQPFIVQGASMEDNFQSGNYLLVDEITYRFREPKRSEVIVFDTTFLANSEHNLKGYYIKRIIGLPGERVVINGGQIFIYNKDNPNGLKLKELYLNPKEETFGGNFSDFTLGEDEYFVMGDNRDNSSDSRFWGSLKAEHIVGKPFVRLFPFDSIIVFSQDTFGRYLGN
jgi:signal peptidase I